MLGHVDDDELVRLLGFTVDHLGDDLGVAELHLVAFATHRLDEDGELELSTAEHDERVGRLGLFHANGEVSLRLALEALAELTARQVLGSLALSRKRRRVDADAHLDGRLLDHDAGKGARLEAHARVDDGVPHVDFVDARDGDELSGLRFLGGCALQTLERREHLDCALDELAVLQDGDRLVGLHGTGDNAPDAEAPHVVVVIEVVDEDLERQSRVAFGRRHVRQDRLEERAKVRGGILHRALCDAELADRVKDGKVDLLVARAEVAKEVENLVQDFVRAGVAAVDLVDHEDDREAELERLLEDEARLRKRTFGGIHEQNDRVGHEQGALDLATEVGVARGVDHVELDDLALFVGPANARVLREDGDATLPLERVRVHDPVDHGFVLAERAGLAEHVVDERGLAMVDVGDDGDVAEPLVGGHG